MAASCSSDCPTRPRNAVQRGSSCRSAKGGMKAKERTPRALATAADATVGYRVREGLTFSLTLDNVFDNEFAEFPGLPVMGRLILARMRVEF